MAFWEFSPKGIPHRRMGNLLIAFWHPVSRDSWDRLLVSKRQKGMKAQDKIYIIEKGMKIERLMQAKWKLTEDEEELIEKVNWWLKKHVKGDLLYRKDFETRRKKK